MEGFTCKSCEASGTDKDAGIVYLTLLVLAFFFAVVTVSFFPYIRFVSEMRMQVKHHLPPPPYLCLENKDMQGKGIQDADSNIKRKKSMVAQKVATNEQPQTTSTLVAVHVADEAATQSSVRMQIFTSFMVR